MKRLIVLTIFGCVILVGIVQAGSNGSIIIQDENKKIESKQYNFSGEIDCRDTECGVRCYADNRLIAWEKLCDDEIISIFNGDLDKFNLEMEETK